MPGRRRWPDVVVALVYFGLAVVPYWDFWTAGGARIAGKGGDVADEAWFLAWCLTPSCTHTTRW